MTRLKRWESPRKLGRNHKGRGGSAKQRQQRKRLQCLRKRLKPNSKQDSGLREVNDLSFLVSCIRLATAITTKLPTQLT